MSNFSHQYSLRVYIEDTDAGGIVYYVNYMKFTERSRTEWFRELGISQSLLLAEDTGFVIRKLEMNNFSSAKLDDVLLIKTRTNKVKGASVLFYQEIYNQNDVLLCSAETLVACVKLSLAKPCAIPPHLLGALKRVS